MDISLPTLVKKKAKEKINDVYETIYVATHPTRSIILTQLESQKMYASKLEQIGRAHV